VRYVLILVIVPYYPEDARVLAQRRAFRNS